MRALLDLFLDICLFRKGPQDVPASPMLLRLSLISYGLVSFLVQLITVTPLLALVQALLDVGLLAGLAYGVLQLSGHGARFPQTLTALGGVGAVLGVVILPVVWWMDRAEAIQQPAEIPVLVFIGWLGWSVAVIAHILRHALSTSRMVAFVYTLGYLVISMWVASSFLPKVG